MPGPRANDSSTVKRPHNDETPNIPARRGGDVQMSSGSVLSPEADNQRNMSKEKSDEKLTTVRFVDWNGPGDKQNPMNWPPFRKWMSVTLVSTITFVASMASTVFAPSVPLLMDELGSRNLELASFVVSVYIIGFCIGPLVLAPLSELYGRAILIHSSNILFVIFSIACAVSINLPMFVVFRLLMGIAGSPPLTIGGGVIADLIPAVSRGKALSIWGMGPILGPVIGPVIGGYLAQKAGWRWIFWFVTILSGVLTVVCFVFFRETHTPTLLKQKAKQLRKNTRDSNVRTRLNLGQSPSQLFKTAIVRPTKMLIFSPIVFILALHVSTFYSYLYFLFTTFTPVFEDQYGFSTGAAGLAYLGLGVGLVLGVVAVGAVSDKHTKKQTARGENAEPEDRLPPVALGGILVPVGFFWYGWSTESHVHWIVPIIGTALIGFGATLAFLPVQIYLIDVFTIYAASAIATNTVVRNLFGATLPLASRQLYVTLGLGWGNSLLAFIALAFSPVPFLLIRYGKRIRTNPRFQPSL